MKGALLILVSLMALAGAREIGIHPTNSSIDKDAVAANSISNVKPWDSLNRKVSHIENKLAGMDNMFSKTQEILSGYVDQTNVADSNIQDTAHETSRNGSSQIVFESVPRMILPFTTANVTLSCRLGSPPISNNGGLVGGRGHTADISDVTSIVITKDGADVAAVTQSGVRNLGDSPHVDITGELSGIPGKGGFLQVVYLHPSGQASGSYVCDVSGLFQHGHGHVISKAVKVEEKEVSNADLIEEIHELKTEKDESHAAVNVLLATLNETNQIIADQGKVINDLLNVSLSQEITIKSQEKKIDAQNDRIDAHQNMIEGLRSTNYVQDNALMTMNDTLTSVQQTVNTHVYFSAGLSSSKTLSHGSTVIFDKVFTNVGGNYNPKTGHFECREAGFYLFLMHMENQSNKYARVSIYHNSNDVVYMFTDDDYDYQTASNSVILQLSQGDIVQVKASGSTSYLYGISAPRTTFTGVLLALA